MINIENLTKRFDERIAVAGIDLEIKSGEIFGLLGPNGAGKTTTVRIMTLLSKKNSGSVRICGYDIEEDSEKIKELIGVVPQHMSLDQDLTGRENLILQARLHHLKDKEGMKQRINEILDFVELADRADDKSRKYSGGMKRRLMIGMALLHKPKILFLDEPTTGLDMVYQEEIFRFSKSLTEMGKTILMVVHELNLAAKYCSRIILLGDGTVIADGKPDDVFTETVLSKAYHAPVRVIRSHNTNEIIEISTKEDSSRYQRDRELLELICCKGYVC